MERKRLLYLVSSDPLVSPFDVNMAADAGYQLVVPYAGFVGDYQAIDPIQALKPTR